MVGERQQYQGFYTAYPPRTRQALSTLRRHYCWIVTVLLGGEELPALSMATLCPR